jgi:ATP-dependent Clp protease protease subunit
MALTRRMAEIIAHHSQRPLDDVLHDIERDKFMTPEEALEYGLIDGIIAPRRGLATLSRDTLPPSPPGELETT